MFDPFKPTPACLEWEAWRSREIIFVKPHINGRGESEYRDRDGKTYPEETFKRRYERIGKEEESSS